MLDSSVARILADVDETAVVLDIGAWAKPFSRADWVMDLCPYETRGMLGRQGEGPERFTKETWIQRDICDREPYPFDDGEIDFVICSHTLEDIRDPIWVCSEMVRIAKAGYIEIPSRLEEQTYGFQGDLVGWGHHRWLIDVLPGRIEFVFKNWRVRQPGNHFPAGFRNRLSEEERVQTLWWEERFDCQERLFLEREELDDHLSRFVAEAHRTRGDAQISASDGIKQRARRALERLRATT